jgi:hypothetical protein
MRPPILLFDFEGNCSMPCPFCKAEIPLQMKLPKEALDIDPRKLVLNPKNQVEKLPGDKIPS